MKARHLFAIVAMIGVAAAAPPVPTGAAGYIPDWLDTDGDGVVSELERQAFVESRKDAVDDLASQWDTNDDGVVDEDERAAAIAALKAKATEKLEELFLSVAGEDGVLSYEEFAALVPSDIPGETVALLFGLLDSDNDGEVTVAEFLAVVGGGVTPPVPPVPPVPGS